MKSQDAKLQVGILGGTGYTGRELIRLLLRHPRVGGIRVYGRTPGAPLYESHPELRGVYDEPVLPLDPPSILKEVDTLFMALPHGMAMDLAPLFQGKMLLVDLSADYRLQSAASWERWYQDKHRDSEGLGTYVYGLPEWQRASLKTARRIACPGCYPTAILLGALPVLEKGWVQGSVIADAKSGHSGAGKKLSPALHAGQASDNIQPYKIGNHQHTGEIEQVFAALSGEALALTFTPQMMPFDRGILASLYMDLKQPRSSGEIIDLYHARYGNEPFIRLGGMDRPPCLKDVVGTNFCDIGLFMDERLNRLTVIACIDNLLKGASGQAVQAMNIASGFGETEGLYG